MWFARRATGTGTGAERRAIRGRIGIGFGLAIGVGLGALYPNFSYENAAEIPTSFGGAVCMIFSVVFVGFAVAVEAWPIYTLTMQALYRGKTAAPTLWLIAPSVLLVLALTIAASVTALRLGFNNLEKLREQ